MQSRRKTRLRIDQQKRSLDERMVDDTILPRAQYNIQEEPEQTIHVQDYHREREKQLDYVLVDKGSR